MRIILHSGGADEEPGAGYRQYVAAAFDRLGHGVTALERAAPTGNAGKMLMTVAVERGADMIAVGGFGPSSGPGRAGSGLRARVMRIAMSEELRLADGSPRRDVIGPGGHEEDCW